MPVELSIWQTGVVSIYIRYIQTVAPQLEHTLQTVPACSSADIHESPSIPTQFAAACGYVVTPARWVQVGCWKTPWMTLIWLLEGDEGTVLTEPHQLALLAVGLALRVFRCVLGGGVVWPMRLRPNSKGSSLISDFGIGTPFRVAVTVKVSSARAWWATRADPSSAVRVHRMARA
jgi:hypothetical protein